MSYFTTNPYRLTEDTSIITPNLLLYPALVRENIKSILKDISVDRLRPHIKTNKSKHVIQLMLEQGIYKFKCATLYEARLLAELQVQDILIAYPIVGDQIAYLLQLQQEFPASAFRILVDNIEAVKQLSIKSLVIGNTQEVYVDINLGMNRTGVVMDLLSSFVQDIQHVENVNIVGFHGYDGHIREEKISEREHIVKAYFDPLLAQIKHIEDAFNLSLNLVFGGSNTYPVYKKYDNIECSPGTFVLWDWGYHSTLPEQSFQIAAILISRVVSKPNENFICLDLGYKAISSENPIHQRLHFLEKEDWQIVSQSEEHLVVCIPNEEWNSIVLGSLVYVIPYHICPTVAMYPTYQVVDQQRVVDQWTIARRY